MIGYADDAWIFGVSYLLSNIQHFIYTSVWITILINI